MIIKREVVMVRHPDQQSKNFVYFEAEADEELHRSDGYYMTNDMYELMERPDIITITIEPGDTLNTGGKHGVVAIESTDTGGVGLRP